MLAATTTLTSGGCRSCSSCHDYDPPVANCDCNACGCHRAGSATGGYVNEGYGTDEYVVEPSTEGPGFVDPGNPDTQGIDEVRQPMDPQ
jgi:hypothetical protein